MSLEKLKTAINDARYVYSDSKLALNCISYIEAQYDFLLREKEKQDNICEYCKSAVEDDCDSCVRNKQEQPQEIKELNYTKASRFHLTKAVNELIRAVNELRKEQS